MPLFLCLVPEGQGTGLPRTVRFLSLCHSFSSQVLSTLCTMCHAPFKILMIQYWTKQIKVLSSSRNHSVRYNLMQRQLS